MGVVETPLLKRRIRFKKIEKKKVEVDTSKVAAAAAAVSIHETLQEYTAAAVAAIEIHETLKAVPAQQAAAPLTAISSWVASWRLEASTHLCKRGRIKSW